MEYTKPEYLERSMAAINHTAMLTKVIVPSAVLILGSTFLGNAYIPVAVALATGWGIYVVLTSGPSGKQVLKPDSFQDFPLVQKTDISHNTAIYRFGLPDPLDTLGLPIGQHISLQANINNKDVVRSYTPITSDEEHQGYFELIVKAYPTGNISKYLAGMKVGDKMAVRGPKGAMVYTPNMVRHFAMIAGGTGITPMLQIIRAIIRHRPRKGGNDKTQVDLIFANVNPEDILLKEDLDKLAAEDEGFRVHYVLNNPPEGWTGGVGFVTADMIKAWCPAPAKDTKMLLCGPPPMISAMKKAAEGLGWEKARAVSKLPDQVFAF